MFSCMSTLSTCGHVGCILIACRRIEAKLLARIHGSDLWFQKCRIAITSRRRVSSSRGYSASPSLVVA
jgi:hypothetical protein